MEVFAPGRHGRSQEDMQRNKKLRIERDVKKDFVRRGESQRDFG